MEDKNGLTISCLHLLGQCMEAFYYIGDSHLGSICKPSSLQVNWRSPPSGLDAVPAP